MSNLKVGDLVMVGGAASAEDRAKNAGRFRTVVGFVPAGFTYQRKDGSSGYRLRDSAVLDGDLWNMITTTGRWHELHYKSICDLVKINPGDADDETLAWAGLPDKQYGTNGVVALQTQTEKEPA